MTSQKNPRSFSPQNQRRIRLILPPCCLNLLRFQQLRRIKLLGKRIPWARGGVTSMADKLELGLRKKDVGPERDSPGILSQREANGGGPGKRLRRGQGREQGREQGRGVRGKSPSPKFPRGSSGLFFETTTYILTS